MIRKGLIIAILATTLCLAATLFLIIPTRSQTSAPTGNITPSARGITLTVSSIPANDWPMFHRDLSRTGFLNASSSEYLPYVGLLWNCDVPGGGVCGSPEVSDLNGDGKVEIVVGAQDGVFCFSDTGVLLWNYSTGSDANLPTVADLYSDGKEMVLVSSNNGMVYCLNGTDGNLIWNSTCTGNPSWLDAPTVADINNDGKMEVIAITGYANCFDRDGSKIWDYVYPGGGFDTQPAIADINNDGKPELVFNHQGYLCVLTGDGKLLMYSASGGYGSECSPVIADINNDGALEIILANYGGVFAFNSSGGLSWGKMIGATIFACPAIADVNNDGEMEIAVAKIFGTVCLLDGNGNQLWSYQAKGWGRDQSPVMADIDGNGKPEIIIGPVDGLIYCLNCEGRELWNYYVGSDAALSPAIADVNGDGVLNIVTTSGSGLFVLTPSAEPTALSASISPNSALIPVGNSSVFTSIVSGGVPPYSCQWCLNDTPVSGATSDSWTFTPTSFGVYTVYLNVTDSAGVILISDTATVDVSAEVNYVFLVSSNSTISGLAFNATGEVLSFNATGPGGTTGYAQITISKSIVADPSGIIVLLDSIPASYTTTSLDDSWLLTLDYTHSTHQVQIDLPATVSSQAAGGGGRMPYMD